MTNIVVPQLGESVIEARVAKWLKKAGDTVAAGDALVELETEKIDLEVSADRAGVLASIAHGEGADVKVGEVLAILDDSGASGDSGLPAVAVAKAGQRHLAYMSVWAVAFVAMSASGYLGDTHPGQFLPFWQKARPIRAAPARISTFWRTATARTGPDTHVTSSGFC